MQVWQLTKSLVRIFLLRARPAELPISNGWLTFLSLTYLATKTMAYMWFVEIVNRYDRAQLIHLDYMGAFLVALVWILVLFAILRTTLSYYNIVERFAQTALALVGVDCIFNVLFLVWLGMLALAHQPMGTHSIASILLLLSFVLMLYWQFMVYIHILVSSMEVSILKAGIFALFYMLVQQNLADSLLNAVMTITKTKGLT